MFARLLDLYGQDLAAWRVFFEISLGRLRAYSDRIGGRGPKRVGRRPAGGHGPIMAGPAMTPRVEDHRARNGGIGRMAIAGTFRFAPV
jgi:hypothetical protein